ncbi:MAG: GCN5-related N-acetyltransferase [uncultured Thermomicrobiales bacterium]|uniref:GCN5-related N-acetyltransferase n=1 Tax=uncultured Thermomicrobiales bacterium TaxID=1645740 RepID=A0A6J4UUJ6_9BACT|nr:MAG: GCN5-related N-acetyltransferase [uncultured Thermomicrobiales bacterium]
MPQFQTERLTIRPFARDLMLTAIADSTKAGARLGLRVAEGWPNAAERDALPFLADELARQPGLAEWGMQILIHTEEAIIIGTAGFKGKPLDNGTVELGYGIAPAYQGRGYATEAVRGLIAWAFTQSQVKRVFANCLPENAASARVLTKAGFQPLPPTVGYLNWELRRGW